METNVTDCFISTVHKICVTNHTKGKFLSITRSGLCWTDNSNFASCFDSAQEVMEYTERQYVQDFIGDEQEQYVWTDTGEAIFE